VSRALEGDRGAFRALYDVAFQVAWVWSLRSTGDVRLAREVTEKALRRAFASLAGFDGAASFGVWLLGFAETALRELKEDACPPVAPAGEEEA